MKHIKRVCDWALQSELEMEYHNTVWGRPEHNDRQLFRMLILEGQQAGLSWVTILKKIKAFDEAYDYFDPKIIADYDEEKVKSLMENAGIIRNQRKIRSAIQNAKAFFPVVEEFGSFDAYLWGFVDGKPIINHFKTPEEVPANTPLSDEISKDLKKRGFNFVGSTIIYAYMQAIGMVNDHLVDCPCH